MIRLLAGALALAILIYGCHKPAHAAGGPLVRGKCWCAIGFGRFSADCGSDRVTCTKPMCEKACQARLPKKTSGQPLTDISAARRVMHHKHYTDDRDARFGTSHWYPDEPKKPAHRFRRMWSQAAHYKARRHVARKAYVRHTPEKIARRAVSAGAADEQPTPTQQALLPINPVAAVTGLLASAISALTGDAPKTAVYDIAAHTVYMPNGATLEAHSGIGAGHDNPRHARLRNVGPTPPNVYDLTLRERPFYGVRALRLNPTNQAQMHGRDGMLAHTYLGGGGRSHGCMVFKNYKAFLSAFERGEVNRVVVVPRLGAG